MVARNRDEFTQLLWIASKSVGQIKTDMQDGFVFV